MKNMEQNKYLQQNSLSWHLFHSIHQFSNIYHDVPNGGIHFQQSSDNHTIKCLSISADLDLFWTQLPKLNI